MNFGKIFFLKIHNFHPEISIRLIFWCEVFFVFFNNHIFPYLHASKTSRKRRKTFIKGINLFQSYNFPSRSPCTSTLLKKKNYAKRKKFLFQEQDSTKTLHLLQIMPWYYRQTLWAFERSGENEKSFFL